MPRLPVRHSQASLNVTPGQRIDPGQASRSGRAMQQIGSQVKGMAAEVQKHEDQWAKARDLTQTTTARNQRDLEMMQLVEDAKNETDYSKLSEYQDKLSEIKSRDYVIDNDDAKAMYQQETDFEFQTGSIKLQSHFKGMMVRHQQVELEKRGRSYKERYIAAQSEVERENLKTGWIQDLERNKEAGTIDVAVHSSEVTDIDDWEYERALRDAGEDPEYVVNNIDKYGVDDAKQKKSIVDMAKATMSTNNFKRELAASKMQSVNEGGLNNLIFSDEDSMTLAEKVAHVNELEHMEKISKSYAVTARRVLTDKDRLKVSIKTSEYADTIRLMYDANIRFDADRDENTYLKSVRNIQERILSSRGISPEDKAKLQGEMDTITKKKVSQATMDLTKKVAVDREGYERSKIFRDADEHFQNQLPDKPELRSEALRQFFYRMEGKQMTEAQARPVIQQVAATMLVRDKKSVHDAFDFGWKTEGNDADLRLEYGNKSQKWAVILFKNNKRVKVVKWLDGVEGK